MRDLELLRMDNEVIPIFILQGWGNLFWDVKEALRMIYYAPRCDLVFCWFADFSYYPVKFASWIGKKTAVVVGGYDVALLPELNYGALLDEKKKIRVNYTLKRSDVVLVVDEGLAKDIRDNLDIIPKNLMIVPTYYDPDVYKPGPDQRKEVLSVCSASEWNVAIVKGVDVFISCAKKMPNVKFILVGLRGKALDEVKKISPDNLELHEPVSSMELLKMYQSAWVYCQFSVREGLPNAVCEAMLCGCVPVGSDVQGIRSAIGDSGFLVPYGDDNAASIAIEKAFGIKNDKARQRIIMNFNRERRRGELRKILHDSLEGID